jgi:hypothetical protein
MRRHNPLDTQRIHHSKPQFRLRKPRFLHRPSSKLRFQRMSGQTANIPRPSAIHSPVPQLAELGNGRPALLGGPMVWEGKWFSEDENRYIFTLSDIDLLEIEAALAKFKGENWLLIMRINHSLILILDSVEADSWRPDSGDLSLAPVRPKTSSTKPTASPWSRFLHHSRP